MPPQLLQPRRGCGDGALSALLGCPCIQFITLQARAKVWPCPNGYVEDADNERSVRQTLIRVSIWPLKESDWTAFAAGSWSMAMTFLFIRMDSGLNAGLN
jgi:hypothetical protein